jgi:hypothetical protein
MVVILSRNYEKFNSDHSQHRDGLSVYEQPHIVFYHHSTETPGGAGLFLAYARGTVLILKQSAEYSAGLQTHCPGVRILSDAH